MLKKSQKKENDLTCTNIKEKVPLKKKKKFLKLAKKLKNISKVII